MSTFVFAPSWVTYPNHPTTTNNNTINSTTTTTTNNNNHNNHNNSKALKQEEVDEFPTLLGRNSNNNNSNNNNSNNNSNNNNFKKKPNHNNSVWSNSRLIRKIHNEEEERDDTDYEELERLKALVPKTKKSFSASNSITSSPKIKPTKSTRQLSQHQKKPSSSTSSPIKAHHNTSTYIGFIPTPTSATSPKQVNSSSLSPAPPALIITPSRPKDCISEQEQLHFIHFIKSWTSTGFFSRDYSHGNNSRSSSDSGFHSDSPSPAATVDIMSSRSFFQYDPFPVQPRRP